MTVAVDAVLEKLEIDQLMNIDGKPRRVCDEKQQDDDEQHCCLLSFVGFAFSGGALGLACSVCVVQSDGRGSGRWPVDQLPSAFHDPINPIVQEAQASKGNDALDQKLGNVNVPLDVGVVEPQLGRSRDVTALFVRFVKRDFEAFGNVKDEGEYDHRQEVRDEDPAPRVDPFALVVVLDRSPDCPVALQSQCHRDVDRTAQDKVVSLVEKISKSVLVDLVELAVVVFRPSDAFRDAAQDVQVVGDGQEDE